VKKRHAASLAEDWFHVVAWRTPIGARDCITVWRFYHECAIASHECFTASPTYRAPGKSTPRRPLSEHTRRVYIGRYGTKRVAKAVLISAIPPVMLKSAANPGGTPIEEFDKLRTAVLADRAQFWKDLSLPFYGYNRPGAKISEGVRESFWLQSMMTGFPASYFCIKAFSETDLTGDLKKFDVPTLIIHGDDDQIVPIADSALLSSKIVKGATLKVYKGAPHGLCTTHKNLVNEDLLAFIKGSSATG
jgi:pimeloyl-ACP methyl ester carboxylesterase